MVTPSSRRSRPRRLWLKIGLPIAVVAVAGALWAASAIGPLLGFYPFPVSPSRYVELTVSMLDGGYYADSDEWRTERARVLAATEGVTDYAVLHAELKKATKIAGGKHSFFLTPEEAGTVDEESTTGFEAPGVATDAGVTTLTLPAFGAAGQGLQQEYADTLANGIREAAPTTCGWIIDLRSNGGGNMYPMLSGLAPLLPNGPAMSFESAGGERTPVMVHDDGIGVGPGTEIKIDATDKVIGHPLAVLFSNRTASSGEAVATVFRGLSGAASFGTETAGYTSGNSVMPLPDGAKLILTRGVYIDRNGVNLNEEPMQPDHVTSVDEAPAAALRWIRDQGCAG